MKNKIVALIQQFGPLLPVEVASKTNLDSFMAKAYLSELIADGKIKTSKEKIADSYLYYLPGQESRVQTKFTEITGQSQKTAATYAPSKTNVTPEVKAKQDAFAQRLKEIEQAESKRKVQQPIKSQPQPRLRPTPQPSQQIPPPQKPIYSHPTPPPPPKMPSFDVKPEKLKPEEFIGRAMDWIRLEGLDIIKEISSKKTEVEIIVKAHTHFGLANFYIKIKQKKSITEADLIAVYAASMEQKCPGVLITNGTLAKSAKNFLEEKGGIIKVKQL